MSADSLVTKIETIILWGSLVVMAYAVIVSTPSIKESFVLATTVKPETFTELYFDDHNNLPKTSEQYQLYKIAFTIHNLENKDMSYPYTISLEREGYKLVVGKDNVMVKNNESKTIESVIGPLNELPKKVVVNLTDKNQFISFWVNKKYE